jgi:hypothetical protein
MYTYPVLISTGWKQASTDLVCTGLWYYAHMVAGKVQNYLNLLLLIFQVGRLHCLLPWWEDATVDFMINGGYNVVNMIKQVFKAMRWLGA